MKKSKSKKNYRSKSFLIILSLFLFISLTIITSLLFVKFYIDKISTDIRIQEIINYLSVDWVKFPDIKSAEIYANSRAIVPKNTLGSSLVAVFVTSEKNPSTDKRKIKLLYSNTLMVNWNPLYSSLSSGPRDYKEMVDNVIQEMSKGGKKSNFPYLLKINGHDSYAQEFGSENVCDREIPFSSCIYFSIKTKEGWGEFAISGPYNTPVSEFKKVAESITPDISI